MPLARHSRRETPIVSLKPLACHAAGDYADQPSLSCLRKQLSLNMPSVFLLTCSGTGSPLS